MAFVGVMGVSLGLGRMPVSLSGGGLGSLAVRKRASVRSSRFRSIGASVRMSASSDTPSSSEVVIDGPFKGHYGSWYLTKGDVDGVTLYRSSLLATAVASSIGAAIALTQSSPSSTLLDAMYILASGTLGVAFWSIHIYMKPMHNLLKTLWIVGSLGGLATLFLSGEGLVLGSYDQSLWLLASGWSFVALTGLFFKEAICFNRQEAWGLMALVPMLTGGHFLHILPANIERGGVVAFAALFLFFALRKFQQPSTDDLGDKSVFDYLEQQAKQQ